MPKILVIDHKRDHLTCLSDRLKVLIPDVTFITAPSSQVGLEKAGSDLPDTILLAVDLPKMDGFEVLQRLKKNPITSPVPVILLTDSRTSDEIKAKGLEEGAEGFLSKPIDDHLLAAQVKSALKIKRAEDELRKERDHLEKTVEERTRSLKNSEDRFRKLIEASPEGIGILEKDGTISYASPKLLEILGHESEIELLGKRPVERIVPEDRERMAKNLGTVFQGGKSAQASYQFLQKDGTRIWGEVNSALLTDSLGNSAGLIAIIRDVTERKQLEEERITKSKLESLGILAGGIAHDFNNVLSIIIGNLELARMDDQIGEEISSFIEEAEKAALKAKNLARQFITFSGGGVPVKKLISLSRILIEQVTFTLSGSSVGHTLSLPDDLWQTEVEEDQIGLCLRNIILNAREAMPEGGTITVKAENWEIKEPNGLALSAGDYVKLTIANPGSGIPEEILPKIFDPYFSTKERGVQKGMGLGLTICYSILKKHRGTITATSAPDQGTTFTLYLPAMRKPVLEIPARPATLSAKGKILVMDDEKMIREMNRSLLTRMGFEVELAEDGERAIDLFQKARNLQRPFDLVLLDLTVRGGMGGKRAIQALTRIDPGVKAILISGYSNDPVFRGYTQYGFKGVLAKPYLIDDLRDTIFKVIGSGE